MASSRQTTTLSTMLLRPFLRTGPRTSLRITSQRFATGDYGSGEGDPVGENPQDAGPSASSDLEHPGPPPPDVGQGSGSTPTKGTSEGHNISTPSGGSSSGEGKSSAGNTGTQGAQPKILNESPPSGKDASPEVQQHNKELENRAEKTHEKAEGKDAEKDKVGKDFWAGHGGVDREP